LARIFVSPLETLGFLETVIFNGTDVGYLAHSDDSNFMLGYPDNRITGVFIIITLCLLISPLFTAIRQRGNSVIPAGIFHGTLQFAAIASIVFLNDPKFPWEGLMGIGGLLAVLTALAVLVFIKMRARRDSNPRPPA
jgi:O-antigen/teichoic acid export membrane protein